MLDAHAARIQVWLELDPALSADMVLRRLIELAPDRFTAKQLRTVQRAVKSMRLAVAQELITGRVAAITLAGPMSITDARPALEPA